MISPIEPVGYFAVASRFMPSIWQNNICLRCDAIGEFDSLTIVDIAREE